MIKYFPSLFHSESIKDSTKSSLGLPGNSVSQSVAQTWKILSHNVYWLIPPTIQIYVFYYRNVYSIYFIYLLKLIQLSTSPKNYHNKSPTSLVTTYGNFNERLICYFWLSHLFKYSHTIKCKPEPNMTIHQKSTFDENNSHYYVYNWSLIYHGYSHSI